MNRSCTAETHHGRVLLPSAARSLSLPRGRIAKKGVRARFLAALS
jgi:hypothetical protein